MEKGNYEKKHLILAQARIPFSTSDDSNTDKYILIIEEDNNIFLMITNPDGFIIIFYYKYVIYYTYNNENSKLKSSKSINSIKVKFIDYANEKKCK